MTTIGMTRPRSWSKAPAKTAATWSRCCSDGRCSDPRSTGPRSSGGRSSDVIACACELAYASAHGFRLVAAQRWNLGRARGGVEADGGQVEDALQRARGCVDVLDA